VTTQHLILHDGMYASYHHTNILGLIVFHTKGPEEPARQMLLKAGLWANALHNEIWVFNQGFWRKDAGLWQEIQKADWKDVILKDEFKKALKKDVDGFFESEELYKKLGIPWKVCCLLSLDQARFDTAQKRGLILHGPPGMDFMVSRIPLVTNAV
jgi:transitional endoplasmic reticulum ATPase